MRTPTLPQFRIMVAAVLLGMWLLAHLVDIISARGAATPFVDAMAGAVVTWLFGSAVLRQGKNGDDE